MTLTELIRAKALETGFDLFGIAPAKKLAGHEPVVEAWCSSGMNAGMNYLCTSRGKRTDPSIVFPGVRSVVVVGLNYFSERKQGGKGTPVISRYAYGRDYHFVIKARLGKLMEFIVKTCPETKGKIFVDSAPIFEKAWAREAGLGWQGRHSIIINETIGSFFFIGILLLDLELDYDIPYNDDKCAGCRLCVNSCPTGAINDDRTIDARKCISYLTIEDKSPMPEKFAARAEGMVFGCDRCQEVCPWNRHATPSSVSEFMLSEEIAGLSSVDWKNLTRERFKKLFKGSPIERKKYEIFMQNVASSLPH